MNSKMSFSTVSRKPLVDEVVKQLQSKISSGDIKPGDKIPTEPELMELFNVGRSTIREAVRVLVHAGLLEKKQGFGTYLKYTDSIQEPLDNRLRRADILEVYEVRQMMELEIAKLAAMRRDEDDLRIIKEHLDTRNKALDHNDIENYIASDIQFHIAVAIATKNSVVIDLYKSFSLIIHETLITIFANPKKHDPQTTAHIKLYESIRDRDAEAAVASVTSYLKGTMDEVIAERG